MTNPGDAGSRNGFAVATLGTQVISGAPYAVVGGQTNSGVVHLYDASGNVVRNFSVSGVGSGSLLGTSVAATSDGMVVAGAPGNTGAVYLFDPSSGSLVLTIQNPTHKAGENFGNAVSIVNGNILVGAYTASNGTYSRDGSAYLFDRSGNLLTKYTSPSPNTTGYFGYSVAGFSDGNIAIGAYYDASSGVRSGKAFEFDGTARGTTNSPIVSFSDPAPITEDHFGVSIATSGTTLLIGADGVDVAGLNDGAAFTFDETGPLLHSFYDPSPTTQDAFGHAVAINDSHILISAYAADTLLGLMSNTGRAYVYDPTTYAVTNTLNSPNPYVNGGFGNAVVLFGDTAILGAYQTGINGTNAGAVYAIGL